MARRSFAESWWGTAWVDALEQRARLDPNRLPRGRTYARKGLVRSIGLTPGRIDAVVQGNRPSPYSVRVDIRQFTDEEWDHLLDAIAARASHAAALLDGELDPGIIEDAEKTGVQLLPGPGDLTPHCSCPDWADLCKHSASVIYLVATELDHDPFSLLLLRGRSREQVLAELRRRRSRVGSEPSSSGDGGDDNAPERAVDPGLIASEAWNRVLGELPSPPPWRDQPGHTAPLPIEPPGHLGFTTSSIKALGDDAARRAWQALRGESDTGLAETEEADLARRAADTVGSTTFEVLTERSGVRPRDLMAQALAWEQAGGAGVRMLGEKAWTPPLARMAAARDVVIAGGAPPTQVRVRNNTITVSGRTQIRLSRDGYWYRLDKQGGRWELTAPPAEEPDDLVFARSAAGDDSHEGGEPT